MSSQSAAGIRGRWRITEMEHWDAEYVDLEGEAHITFERDRLGRFQFGAVVGWIDYRISTRDGRPAVEFSWEGTNDSDPASGRGWAMIDAQRIAGRLFFHNGDDSGFVAVRQSRATADSRVPSD